MAALAPERLSVCAAGGLRRAQGTVKSSPWASKLRSLWSSVSAPAGRRGPGPQQRGPGAGLPACAAAYSTAASDGASTPGTGAGGPRVCILGGGFGGLYTAIKLDSLLWPRGKKPQVTLVDQGDRFVFKPLLYELVTGGATPAEVAPPFADVLAPHPAVEFVRGRVAAVRPDRPPPGQEAAGGRVVLEGGRSIGYDWLVLALGAETSGLGVPGVREHAMPFSTYEDAVAVVERLSELDAAVPFPEVAVVGGGLAGVELATAVADRLQGRGRVKIIAAGADIMESAPAGQREAARRALADRSVSVLAGARAQELRLVAGEPGPGPDLRKRLLYVNDAEGQTEIIEADAVLWAAGQAPALPHVQPAEAAAAADAADAAGASGGALPFPLDARGATRTDPTLRVLGHPHVFALGDVAIAEPTRGAERWPATAQVALQQADYVAWNLWASIAGRPLLPFSYQHLGSMMSLGAASGAVALPVAVPPPLAAALRAGPLGPLLKAAGVNLETGPYGASDGVTLEGPLAAALRRAAYLYRQPTDGQRLRVLAAWAAAAGGEAAKVAQRALRAPPGPAGGPRGAPRAPGTLRWDDE